MMRDLLETEADLKMRRKELTGDTKEHTERLEKLGVPLPAWKGFVKIREEAGVIRTKNLSALVTLLDWDLKPAGLQASMDLTTSQGSPTLNVHELHRIDAEGFDAGKEGKKRSVNPYTPATEAAQRFDTAWLRGQAEIASEMQQPRSVVQPPELRRHGAAVQSPVTVEFDPPSQEAEAGAEEPKQRRRRRSKAEMEADAAVAAEAAAAQAAANGGEAPKRRGRKPGSRNKPKTEGGLQLVEGGADGPRDLIH